METSTGSRNLCAIIWLSYTLVRSSNLEIAEQLLDSNSGSLVENH